MYQIFRKFNEMDQRVASYKLEENAKAALELSKEDGLFLKEVPVETREEFLTYLTEKGYVVSGNKATQLDKDGDYLATYLILHYERGSDEDDNYENGYCLKMLKHADINGTIIEDGTVDENGNFCDLDGMIYEMNLDKE
jgi:hypothetical protein